MAGKLRDDICRCEAENNEKVRCPGLVRCLLFPMSLLECPVARRWVK